MRLDMRRSNRIPLTCRLGTVWVLKPRSRANHLPVHHIRAVREKQGDVLQPPPKEVTIRQVHRLEGMVEVLVAGANHTYQVSWDDLKRMYIPQVV